MKSFNNSVFIFSQNNFTKQASVPDKISMINYKNIFLLRKYIGIEGKILPRRLTNLNAKQQRKISKAVKNARIMGFLPFTRRIL